MSFCRHLVTAEPANQNGHRVVQLHIGLKNWFPLEELLFYFIFCSLLWHVVIFVSNKKKSTLYRAEKAQSFTAFLGNPFSSAFHRENSTER